MRMAHVVVPLDMVDIHRRSHSGHQIKRFEEPGMRERTEAVGGKLTIWSALDAGTEVELVIPASRAYGSADIEPQPRMS